MKNLQTKARHFFCLLLGIVVSMLGFVSCRFAQPNMYGVPYAAPHPLDTLDHEGQNSSDDGDTTSVTKSPVQNVSVKQAGE